MIVCVLLPRFELAVAAGGREALAAAPLALAPEIGREQLVGETSAAAEAHGVRAGLRLGEALARCPTLQLVTPDPAGVADAWEGIVGALEGIGAAVESDRPGMAWFDERGLRGLHGGSVEGVITAARRALAVGPRAGSPVAVGAGGRIGAAPSRFAALSAAHRARARRPEIAPEKPASLAAYLAPLPVSLLSSRPEVATLPEALERFGIATLGELAKLSRAALADRFGQPGLLARDLALGRDTPLRPRVPSERLQEVLELPESALGQQLERALGMLIDRVLARPERRGRTVRAVVLSAALVGGGTWRTQLTFREALSDPRRMRLALGGRLSELPAPADSLRLRVEAFGPPAEINAPCSPNRPRSAAPASEKPSAKPAPPPARTPPCASSPWTLTRASQNAASRSRPGNHEPPPSP